MARDEKSVVLAERTPERIRADLESARLELATSVEALKVEVARVTDWREWYRKHTGAFLIGAFAVGLIIGSRRRD